MAITALISTPRSEGFQSMEAGLDATDDVADGTSRVPSQGLS
jgi:hypothetical protein